MTWWEEGEDGGMDGDTKSRVRYCQYFLMNDAALKKDEWVWFHAAALSVCLTTISFLFLFILFIEHMLYSVTISSEIDFHTEQ